ncbi:MAG TPA: ROK family protein [Anaerolineae bacterium]|nr:ROK family protein [Anaerolineae bacterium]
MTEYVLAADIGGTKVATGIISARGEIAHQSKAPTALSSPTALIAQVSAMVEQDLKGAGLPKGDVLGIGVGIPAVIDADHKVVIWAPNLPGWRNIPLHEELVARTGLPVRIEYDGHTAVLGEWWLGAGCGYSSVVFIIIGTGLGGGMILDGRLYRGANRLAGAAGWFVLDPKWVEDKHARQFGQWESVAAGPGIARMAMDKLQSSTQPSLLRDAPNELTAQAVFNAARQGDMLAKEIVKQVTEFIGIGVANIVSLINPEIVILGGGIGLQSDLLLDGIRQRVLEQAQPISAQTVKIVPSQLGDAAGLLGAAKAAFLIFQKQGGQ